MSNDDKASPVQGDVIRNCGNCRHWFQAKPYRWGNCVARLPAWLECADSSGTILPEDVLAEDCDAFDPYNAVLTGGPRKE